MYLNYTKESCIYKAKGGFAKKCFISLICFVGTLDFGDVVGSSVQMPGLVMALHCNLVRPVLLQVSFVSILISHVC
jgi:hypothetical protein